MDESENEVDDGLIMIMLYSFIFEGLGGNVRSIEEVVFLFSLKKETRFRKSIQSWFLLWTANYMRCFRASSSRMMVQYKPAYAGWAI